MKILVSFAAAAALLLAAAPAPAAHKGYASDCGDQTKPPPGAPYTNLKADNVSCKTAHKVADKYVSKPFTEGYKGWACDAKQTGYEQLKVKCSRDNRGGQRLKFDWGA